MNTDPVPRATPSGAPDGADVGHADSKQSWRLPAQPESIAEVREHAVDFARSHGAGPDIEVNLALAVSEATTNSVLHAFLERPAGTVTLTVEAHPGQLVATVADDGHGMRPRPDSPGLGMGLPLIGNLATAVDIHEAPGGGTVVRMTFTAPGVVGPPPRRRRGDLRGVDPN